MGLAAAMKCVKGATGPFLDRLYGSFRVDLQNIYPQGSPVSDEHGRTPVEPDHRSYPPAPDPRTGDAALRRTHVLAVHVYPSPVGLITSSEEQVLNAVSMCVSAPPIVMATRNCLRSYGVRSH